MWQPWVVALGVVPLSVVGGVLALSLRGMPLTGGAAAGLCCISGLALVQAWIVTWGMVRATKVFSNIHTACSPGAQAKFKPVFLIGLCVLVGSIPIAFMGANSGAQRPFGTVAIGGIVFSTAGALIAVPLIIAWIAD
jgi:cobalt-zinc-cadmium resistance protein CzcA